MKTITNYIFKYLQIKTKQKSTGALGLNLGLLFYYGNMCIILVSKKILAILT